jgi:hypothetical protein
MTIATMDQLVAALGGSSGQQQLSFFKFTGGVIGAPQFCSYWTVNGNPGAAATPPTGVGEVPTSATLGALPFINPTGGVNAYLAGLRGQVAGGTVTCFMLYDRLVHTSGLVANSTSVQTVNSVAVNRPDSTGTGAELFVEVYGSPGSGSSTPTITYTNQSGVSGQQAIAPTGQSFNAPVSQIIPMSLAAGDTGVRSVQSFQFIGSTYASAGNLGITIARKIAVLPSYGSGGSAASVDPFGLALAPIPSNACLFIVSFGGAQALFGMAEVAQG